MEKNKDRRAIYRSMEKNKDRRAIYRSTAQNKDRQREIRIDEPSIDRQIKIRIGGAVDRSDGGTGSRNRCQGLLNWPPRGPECPRLRRLVLLKSPTRIHLQPTASWLAVEWPSFGRPAVKERRRQAIRRRKAGPGESCPPGTMRCDLRPSRSRPPFGRARRTRSRPRRRPSAPPC